MSRVIMGELKPRPALSTSRTPLDLDLAAHEPTVLVLGPSNVHGIVLKDAFVVSIETEHGRWIVSARDIADAVCTIPADPRQYVQEIPGDLPTASGN